MTREQLDEIFPTLLRYTGLVATVVLIGFTIGIALTAGVTAAAALAPGYVAATGMVLYKTVHEAVKRNGGNGDG